MKKTLSRFVLLLALSPGCAFALLPLIPLGFGLGLVGTSASGLTLALVGAAVAVGAAIGLVNLATPDPASTNSGPVQVMINPSDPLQTPSGWTPPVSPAVQPSPPTNGGSALVAFPWCSSAVACSASTINNFVGAQELCRQFNATSNFVPGPVTGNQIGTCSVIGIAVSHNTYNYCLAGYTLSGNNCVLSNAAVVEKPSDGICTIVRTGNTYSGDPRDPDCAVSNIPATVTISGSQITARPSGGSTQRTTINADGSTTITNSTTNNTNNTTTTTTINISASTGAGTTKITGIGTTTVNGTGDLAGQGTAPATPFPSDYNRETTQQGISNKLDQLKAGQCGGAGQPPCKLDETGTPTTDALTAGRAEVAKGMDDRKSQIESSTDKSAWPSPFSITFPTGSNCTDISFAMPRNKGNLEIAICSKLAPVRGVLEWMLGIFAAFSIYLIGINAVRGS